MKTFLKILLAIVIVGAIGFVIYLALPEEQKMYIQGNIQYRKDADAKEHVDKLKGIKVPGASDGITFGKGLEKLCKSTAWYYEKGSGNDWTVTFYGSKATIDMTGDGLDSVYTNKPMKVIFSVRNDSEVDIDIYVDGNLMNSDEKISVFNRIADAGRN